METSEKIDELAGALAKAQGEIKGALKDATNPFFKSKYATLDAVWDACRAALSSNGLSIVQGASTPHEATVSVTTMLLHSSGQWIRDVLTLPAGEGGPQETGSALTYARRYGLSAMVGVAPEDDDDANAAQGAPAAKKPVPGYYRAKAPVHGPEAIHAGTPPTKAPMGDEALKDISEELMPNTDAAKDDRAFLEKAVMRKANEHDLSANERAAAQAVILKGKPVNKAASEDLNKLYLLLMDPQAVKGWREEVARKVNA